MESAMTKHGKLLDKILSKDSDASIRFDELCFLLKQLGFQVRIRGSHFIFRKSGIREKINLQKDGAHAKPYQVKQIRAVILAYGMSHPGEQ
jgi:predicted RNA binding protein YcfA (HicA-like mRNA interferase family)